MRTIEALKGRIVAAARGADIAFRCVDADAGPRPVTGSVFSAMSTHSCKFDGAGFSSGSVSRSFFRLPKSLPMIWLSDSRAVSTAFCASG